MIISSIYKSNLFKDGISIVFNDNSCINIDPSTRAYTICENFINHESYKPVRWGRLPKGIRKTTKKAIKDIVISKGVR